MPKKKPIDKRLDKLFDDIKHEEPSAKSGTGEVKSAPAEKAASPAVSKPAVKRARPLEPVRLAPKAETALALEFQTGPNNWATLQVLDETNERKWTEDDQLLVRQVTDQLTLALENARLFEEAQSRAEDLSVLNEMGNELSTKLDPKAIAEVIYRYTSRLMDTKNFYVALYDENKDEKSYPLAYENGQPIEINPGKVTGRGFTDHIIRNKRAVFASSDVLGHMKKLGIEFVPLGEDETPSQAWLGVPMLVGNRILGVISVQSVDVPNLYTDQDREILATIAGQAAIAVENARLFQESQRRAQEMSALAEVGREVSASLELKTVLERIAEYASILLNSVTTAVYLPDAEFKTLVPFAVVGEEAEEILKDPLQIGTGVLGDIARSGSGEIVNNVFKDPRAITIQGTAVISDEHIMGVPIKLLDRITGLMAVWRVGAGNEFTETEFNFLTNLAQQAAIAIENARLFQDVTNSQGQLSEALRIARIGYFEIDQAADTITFTSELFALLNTSAEKEGGYSFPLQQALDRFVIPEDVPLAVKAVQDAIAADTERGESTSEVRYRTSDGRVIWVSSTYKVEHDNLGQPVRVAGSSQDITERKTNELTQAAITHISESALASSTAEELFKTVHDSIQTILPAKNFYVALHDRAANMLTFPYHVDERDEDWSPRKLGRSLTGFVIRSGKPLRTTPEIFANLEAAGEIISDGAPRVDWLGVPLRSGGVIRGVMVVQTYDETLRITDSQVENFALIGAQTAAALERLQAREELAKSEADLRALFSAMEDVILVYDRDGRYVRVAPTNPSRLFLPSSRRHGSAGPGLSPAPGARRTG
jgi:PAS domain S-box-containing protein